MWKLPWPNLGYLPRICMRINENHEKVHSEQVCGPKFEPRISETRSMNAAYSTMMLGKHY
jgi:hypothetical protein